MVQCAGIGPFIDKPANLQQAVNWVQSDRYLVSLVTVIWEHFLDTMLYLLRDPKPTTIRGTLGELHPDEEDRSNMRFVRDMPILNALVDFVAGLPCMWQRLVSVASTKSSVKRVIRIQNNGESLHVWKKDRSIVPTIQLKWNWLHHSAVRKSGSASTSHICEAVLPFLSTDT